MDMILLNRRDLAHLSAYQSGGLYLLQSVTKTTLFRLGETRNLSSRKGSHESGSPKRKCKEAPDWTQVHRPWEFIWALSLPHATELARRMCAHHLYSAYVRHYQFVDRSGFEAPAESVSRLVEIAEQQLPVFAEINDRQRHDGVDKDAPLSAA
ncbi:MAG TPA: hypothetical protein VF695_12125 [Sphingomonas sp.]|jgi:hypothetical protein